MELDLLKEDRDLEASEFVIFICDLNIIVK